jgi:asparagine synthase (glutamine-hydrolysing)
MATTLGKSVGMFAFALWDRRERVLTVARDRMGEKPLYCGWQDGVFLFASELKSLHPHPSMRAQIDRPALLNYLRAGYVPAPGSIYRGIGKLPPGTYAQLSGADAAGSALRPQQYWSLRDAAESALANPFAGGDDEALEGLGTVLAQAVSLQRVADVPLGAFLSGGIDSSTVVALLQEQSDRPVKTFTIAFHEAAYQEAQYARAVAQRLHTDHTELYVTAREAMDVIPQLAHLHDEPFGDSSAIPTLLVSQLARRQVTVSLSGDGGDELFGGYSRYARTVEIWRTLDHIPHTARKLLAVGCRAVNRCSPLSRAGWRAGRAASYLSAATAPECYAAQIAQSDEADAFVLDRDGDDVVAATTLRNADLYHTMMYADAATYLPDDILTKVDRAAMSVSLETRVPLLDHRVVEFAWRLPLAMKVRNGTGKWLLRQLLRKYLPDSLIERPKMGFGIPVSEWIRGPLRDWAEDLLGESRLRREGILDPRPVRERWLRHLRGVSAEGDGVWQLLMFQSWLAASR